MKKVLFVTNGMSGGGAEKILRTIIWNLDRKKFEITLCSLHEPSDYIDWPEDIKYKIIFRHNAKTWAQRLLVRFSNKLKLLVYDNFPASYFYRLFMSGIYDTEVAFIEGYSTRIVSGSTNTRSKKLAWLHTDMFKNHWSKIAYRSDQEEIECYKKFDGIYGVSKDVSCSLSKLFPSLNSTGVIYNPVDESAIVSQSKLNPELRHIKRHKFHLVSAGRLVEQKGYDRLIPIIANLIKEDYDIFLQIIGEGTQRSQLEKLISKYNLTENIELVGFKSNPYPYFVNSDVFICSSRLEGFSTVITEALILGLPVVATECAGMRELLGENSEFGIITENSDLALEQGIKTILEPETLLTYKDLAKQRGATFTLNNLISKLEECL